VVIALAIGLAGCEIDHRAVDGLSEPLHTPSRAPAATVPLVAHSLITQADHDALEDRVRPNRNPGEVVAIYETLTAEVDALDDDADVLALQRLAILLTASRGGRGWVERATRIGDRLTRERPEHPHTLYLNGYLKRLILQSGAGERALLVAEVNREAAVQVLEDWGRLLEVAPDYQGPRGHDAVAIRADLERLRRGLTAFDAQQAAAPEGPPEPAPPRPSARELTGDELQAHIDLLAFESGSDPQRRVLCRDRVSAERVGGPTVTEARIDLRCALFAGDDDLARGHLIDLVARGGTDAPCRWVEQLRQIAVGTRWDRHQAALEAAGVPTCP